MNELEKRDLKEVREDLYGNGKPGLKYEVVAMKVKINIVLVLQLATVGAVIKGLF